MTLPQDIVGVDVAKDWIDWHRLSTGEKQRVSTTPAALRRFAATTAGALVVFEASGGYERPLVQVLDAAGVGYARVTPRQAREFARASGRLAKTDRVDATVVVSTGWRRVEAGCHRPITMSYLRRKSKGSVMVTLASRISGGIGG